MTALRVRVHLRGDKTLAEQTELARKQLGRRPATACASSARNSPTSARVEIDGSHEAGLPLARLLRPTLWIAPMLLLACAMAKRAGPSFYQQF